MKQTEARELAQRFGVRMCDENGETHGQELYCLGLDDIIDMAKALAQPEQEPVGMYRNKCADGSRCLHGCHTNEPCYTTPPQRKPLTDEQVDALWKAVPNQALYEAIKVFARAIEAAHGITKE